MKPLEIMDALGDIPRDLVNDCFRAPAETADTKHGNESTGITRAAKPDHRSVKVPRPVTAAALAACMMFAAGVGLFLIRGDQEHEVLQSTADSAAIPLTTDTAETEQAVAVTEPAETTAPPAVYAELELHEQEKQVHTWEEKDALLNEARERYRQNGGPLLIDTGKYIAKYFAPDSGADINDLEAKSYLYHMMLNSIDYFSTAEGEMIYGISGGQIIIRFQTDDTAHKSYEYEQSGEGAYETYFSGSDEAFSSFLTNVDLTAGTYSRNFCSVDNQNDFIMRDNDRRSSLPDGTGLAFNRMDGMNLGISCSCCLFPQSIAMSRLDDFDLWHITGTETVLGRNCAAIEGVHSGNAISLLVDIGTGILMKYEERNADGLQTDYSEVTALTVDEPVSVREFDPTGLTPEEPFAPQIPENK
ncbi:MAG: hypothetical protein IKH27_05870 [Oscillospiraceae bacterium]|nr:hypothetical protein [Oscillospiraceae bacterium]